MQKSVAIIPTYELYWPNDEVLWRGFYALKLNGKFGAMVVFPFIPTQPPLL